MTIEAASRRVAIPLSGLTAGPFDTEFPFYAIDVYVNGELADPDDYTIDQDEPGDTGTITFDSAPTAGELLIVGTTPITQPTDFISTEITPADDFEAAVDRMIMIAQELADVVERAPQVAGDEDVDPIDNSEPGKLIVTRNGSLALWEPTDVGFVIADADGILTVEPNSYETNSYILRVAVDNTTPYVVRAYMSVPGIEAKPIIDALDILTDDNGDTLIDDDGETVLWDL